MGYRTHLTLSVIGKPQAVGTFIDVPTRAYLIDNYCIGKCYFNELPEDIEKHIEGLEGLFFADGGDSDDGEITVEILLVILNDIKQKRNGLTDEQIDELHPWYWFNPEDVIRLLERALSENLIHGSTYVQFDCY